MTIGAIAIIAAGIAIGAIMTRIAIGATTIVTTTIIAKRVPRTGSPETQSPGFFACAVLNPDSCSICSPAR